MSEAIINSSETGGEFVDPIVDAFDVSTTKDQWEAVEALFDRFHPGSQRVDATMAELSDYELKRYEPINKVVTDKKSIYTFRHFPGVSTYEITRDLKTDSGVQHETFLFSKAWLKDGGQEAKTFHYYPNHEALNNIELGGRFESVNLGKALAPGQGEIYTKFNQDLIQEIHIALRRQATEVLGGFRQAADKADKPGLGKLALKAIDKLSLPPSDIKSNLFFR